MTIYWYQKDYLLKYYVSYGVSVLNPKPAVIEYQQSSYKGSSIGICLSLVVTLKLLGLYHWSNKLLKYK